MQINNQKKEEITLKIMYEQNSLEFKCKITEILENYLIAFANYYKLKNESLFFLYSGSSLLPTQLKCPVLQIIKSEDRTEKRMLLLAYQLGYDIIQEDEINVILSIESVKIIKLTGKKGEKIKEIIKNSIKLDLNWYTFKYRNNEIDIEQKFDNIADEEDKKQLKIEITVNYTIPLIVNFIKGKKIYTIQCLLGDRVNYIIVKYFNENRLNSEDYYLFYENKIFENYYDTKFYEIISEDKILNSFQNENINNNTIITLPSNENLNETNFKFNSNKKIMAIPINEINKRRIEIEIKIMLKSCWLRYKRKISRCGGSDFKNFLGCCCLCFLKAFCYTLGFVIGLFIVFCFFGGWIVFVKYC